MTEAKSKTWQELGDEFHMMVGYCIAAWAAVDDELFRIFSDCVGNYDQSAIIYYRTPGLDVRVTLTESIVKSVLPPPERESGGHDHPILKAWKEAASNFKILLAVRRRIAHHPVAIRHQPFMAGISRVGELPPSWFEIYVSQHEQIKTGDMPALKVDDLRSHQRDVNALRDRLRRFYQDVLIAPVAKSPLPDLQPD